MDSPVLFLTFNRPETTKEVFEAIKKAKPKKLYLGCDGPRKNHANDEALILEVRNIITAVDWNCEVKTLFRDTNLGCMNACTKAISWFFDQEEEGIILEDDCLPAPSFFGYCEEVLDKYRNDQRVVHINGNNYNTKRVSSSRYSYHFTFFPQVWGWATWRRAWKKFSTDMPLFKEFDDYKYFKHIGFSRRDYEKIRARWLRVVNKEVLNVWDYQWHFLNMLEGNLTVCPKVNQISNLGFRHGSTHSPHVNIFKSELPTKNMELPLHHPPSLFIDPLLNQSYKNMMINEPIMMKIHRKLRSNGINIPIYNP